MPVVKIWKYKNLTLFFVGLIVAFSLSRFEVFHNFLLNLNSLGYLGAFLAGVLFVSTFTVATGAVILLVLAEKLSAIEIGLIAGAGGVIGDLLIFRFVKDNLEEEIKPLYESLGGNHLTKILHTKYFKWTFPVFGALVIASPLPDELGISLLGLTKLKTYQFIFLSFLLNALGIFLVISASTFIKP